MDINQLEVLVTVARERSFSRAAEVLNRTQPAISQAIRRLESEIGEKLFDRSSKDGTLTFAGEVLLSHAKQMLNLRQHAQQAITEMRDLQHGKVTISRERTHRLLSVAGHRRIQKTASADQDRGPTRRRKPHSETDHRPGSRTRHHLFHAE
ncbi:MAG: LysR family transcriptional regulator [Pyrinomonadaceae bacterium]